MSVASSEALPKAGAAGGFGDGREGRKGEGAKEMMGETARDEMPRPAATVSPIIH